MILIIPGASEILASMRLLTEATSSRVAMSCMKSPSETTRNYRPAAVAALLLLLAALASLLSAADVPTERPVLEIRLLAKDVGRVAWSPQGDRLAYDKLTADGRYHLYTANPETLIERCLSCSPLDLRKKNNLNPTWHPSGEYLVFQVQSSGRRLRLDPTDLSTAHRGLYSRFWSLPTDDFRGHGKSPLSSVTAPVDSCREQFLATDEFLLVGN